MDISVRNHSPDENETLRTVLQTVFFPEFEP